MLELEQFQKTIKHQFKNINLLETAFTHRSFCNEKKQVTEHNERLEFLGDAVLEIITTEFLFNKFPDKPEGELTALRSALVCGERLAKVAFNLEIGELIKLSRGEHRSGGSKKPYLLANTFEAITGAIYLDVGLEKTREFIHEFLMPELPKILESNEHIDAKSHFQELAQEKLSITPVYELVSATGPDHQKIFEMAAKVGSQIFGTGKGPSKQLAEQDAANKALKKLV
jgi:ribonuclease III